MKRTLAVMLAVLALFSLCACGSQISAATDTDIPDNIDALAAASLLNDYLLGISANLDPGTSGCSLTATVYAGRILDLFDEGNLTGKSISTTTKDFVAGLDEAAATKFNDQLNLVYTAAQELCGDTGADALSSSGYEAQYYPWDSDAAQSVFSKIYDGADIKIPQ
ncbi:MAG: hypothetical protein EOM14_00290 [Clostridia bacterium]|nr:hypothetical protein [Clostridia bacterium]